MARGAARRSGGPMRVIDFSSQWAGPFAGAVLAHAGAKVTKMESRAAPAALRAASPAAFERLNGEKEDLALDFGDPADRARLAAAAASLEAMRQGGGFLVDAPLAPTAADVAGRAA